jgi:hypothetical protein
MAATNCIKHALSVFIFGSVLVGCGGGGGGGSGSTIDPGSGGGNDPSPPNPSSTTTYGTTSSHGDFATWTITGTTLSAVWQKINLTGGVAATFRIQATCESSGATYGEHSCHVTSATTDAVGVPPPSIGTVFTVLEAEGTALFVYSAADSNTGLPSQLHTGIKYDPAGCAANISGQYLYVHSGPGSAELFGLYQIDTNFESIVHADFGMNGSALANAQLGYLTSNESSTGEELLHSIDCNAGVQRINFNGDEARILRTQNGALVLDLAAGHGGKVAFNRSHAAALEDFANKRFTALSYGDDAMHPYDLAALSSGAVTSENGRLLLRLSGTSSSTSSTTTTIEPISNATLQAKFMTPDPYLLNSALTGLVPDLQACKESIR